MRRILTIAFVLITLSFASAASWVELGRWESNTNKNTETFTVSSGTWGISWNTQTGEHGEGLFSIVVKKPPNEYIDLAANVMGASVSNTKFYTKGTFFLEISATQPYVVSVNELR